jgi:dCMP deaminase
MTEPIRERPSWDQYFLGIATAVSLRADCSRRQIGAILVNKHNRHRGSGYNGGRSKGPSCLKGECPRGALNSVVPGSSYDTGAGTCVAVHAEQNLIMDTTPEDRREGTIYITDVPCDGCLRMLQGSDVVRIVWPNGTWLKYRSNEWYTFGRVVNFDIEQRRLS